MYANYEYINVQRSLMFSTVRYSTDTDTTRKYLPSSNQENRGFSGFLPVTRKTQGAAGFSFSEIGIYRIFR